MADVPVYQVWLSRGRGLEAGPRFASLGDAVRHAESGPGDARYGIRLAGGDWYRWPESGEIMKSRLR